MNKYEVREATWEDVISLAPRMRKADQREVWASGKLTPHQALTQSLEASRDALTASVDGVPVIMFGVAVPHLLSERAVPWMLASDEVKNHAMHFLPASRRFIDEMMQRYDLLVNFVDERNTLSQKWLKWLGFTLEEPEPFGPFQVPFRKFWIANKEDQTDV